MTGGLKDGETEEVQYGSPLQLALFLAESFLSDAHFFLIRELIKLAHNSYY